MDAEALKKAAKEQIFAEAERKAAEVERDFAKIEEAAALAAKYGLALVGAKEERASAADIASPPPAPSKSNGSEALYRIANREAEAMIAERGTPVRFNDLFDRMIERGVTLGGKRPQSTLSAYLSQSDKIESIQRGWYWLKGVPLPGGSPAPSSDSEDQDERA